MFVILGHRRMSSLSDEIVIKERVIVYKKTENLLEKINKATSDKCVRNLPHLYE